MSTPETTDQVAATDAAAAPEVDRFYCPGCGARYPEAGQCDNQHPPLTLEPLTPTAEAESSAEDAGETGEEAAAPASGTSSNGVTVTEIAAPPSHAQLALDALKGAASAIGDAVAALESALNS